MADDDQTSRTTMELMLGRLGHRVSCVQDGAQVLERLQHEAYDCILMDVQMPGLDGLQATRRIRASEAWYKALPVIALTAHAMSGDRERFLQAGLDDYLAKPVDLAELQAVLRNHLAGRPTVAQLKEQ